MRKLFGKKASNPAPKAAAPASRIESKPALAEAPLKTAAAPARTEPPVRAKRPTIIFSLHAPGAQQVSLCGEFNGWSPEATPLTRQNDGQWTTAVALPPGRHQYKFVADGQWLHDPKAPETLPNTFGSLNSVLEVQA